MNSIARFNFLPKMVNFNGCLPGGKCCGKHGGCCEDKKPGVGEEKPQGKPLLEDDGDKVEIRTGPKTIDPIQQYRDEK